MGEGCHTLEQSAILSSAGLGETNAASISLDICIQALERRLHWKQNNTSHLPMAPDTLTGVMALRLVLLSTLHFPIQLVDGFYLFD